MDETILRGPSLEDMLRTSEPWASSKPGAQHTWHAARPSADEMARVLGTTPRRIVTELSGSSIAHWNHGELHDVVEPMTDHVIMTYIGTMQRLERRTGRTLASATARPGVVTIIPSGTSSRWDIDGAVDVLQLYLPHAVLERVAAEADMSGPAPLLERTGYLDPTTSRLLTSAADVLDGSEALDMLFRQQLTDLLATRLLSEHTGTAASRQTAVGGLAPTALRRAIERLRSDDDADLSLAALAADAHLSRFHFCRAFKQSTGLSPHAWLRQHRLARAMTMLRDTDEPIVSIAVRLDYGSQSAFAAAFRRLTGETPSDWRRRAR